MGEIPLLGSPEDASSLRLSLSPLAAISLLPVQTSKVRKYRRTKRVTHVTYVCLPSFYYTFADGSILGLPSFRPAERQTSKQGKHMLLLPVSKEISVVMSCVRRLIDSSSLPLPSSSLTRGSACLLGAPRANLARSEGPSINDVLTSFPLVTCTLMRTAVQFL